MKGILIIRKYKNRRLYDTERSLHLTQEELLALVREGRTVQIQEVNTGEDVTVETLLQLLLSEAGKTLNVLPSEFVHFLVRSNENSLSRFFRDFLPSAFQYYRNAMPGSGEGPRPSPSPFQGLGGAWFSPWTGGAEFGAWPSAAPAPSTEADEVRRRLTELEEELQRLRRKR
jgi:polyhydroxyalkanoate synthesis repressor PhaR